MQISSTTRPQRSLDSKPKAQARKASPNKPQDGFMRSSETADWLYAGASIAGGLVAVAGGATGNLGLAGGGTLVTAVATAFSANRVEKMGIDQAGLVSFGGGGTLIAAGALLAFNPAPPSRPDGPLHQLINKFGFHGL